ncbi:MAG: hypothetical protein RLY87_828 [Chloroflexota bacterium]|jgi:hypothetical protein
MCGAARFRWKDLLDPLIAKGIPIGPQPKPDGSTPTALEAAEVYESRYWSGEPILPVVVDGALSLCAWGNRNETRDYPASGWAKRESYEAGIWTKYQPTLVMIPLIAGYEKGVWFGIDQGVRGLVVGSGTDRRVYMLTVAADAAYAQLTDHDRKPWLIGQQDVIPMAGSRSQMRLW